MFPYKTFPVAPAKAPLKITVIGHHGRMGAMLSELWRRAGHDVRGIDRPAAPVEVGAGSVVAPVPSAGGCPGVPTGAGCAAPHEVDTHLVLLPVDISHEAMQVAVQGAQIVVVCVPVLAFEEALRVLGPCLSPEQVLVDVTSVKIIPMAQMHAVHQGPIVGTHPLFGPAATPVDLVVPITPNTVATEAQIAEVEALFACFGCRCFRTTPDDHDLGVAFAQALNFASNAVYFATVADKEEILPFITPSFRRRIDAGRKQMTDDANMFLGFIAANPRMKDVLASFRETLDKVDSGQMEDVVRKAQHWYLGTVSK